jgi:hypothetical protein
MTELEKNMWGVEAFGKGREDFTVWEWGEIEDHGIVAKISAEAARVVMAQITKDIQVSLEHSNPPVIVVEPLGFDCEAQYRLPLLAAVENWIDLFSTDGTFDDTDGVKNMIAGFEDALSLLRNALAAAEPDV